MIGITLRSKSQTGLLDDPVSRPKEIDYSSVNSWFLTSTLLTQWPYGEEIMNQTAEVFISSITIALEKGDSLEDAVNKTAEETTKFLTVQASDKDFTDVVVGTQSTDTSCNAGN